jgi:hypothetical protein
MLLVGLNSAALDIKSKYLTANDGLKTTDQDKTIIVAAKKYTMASISRAFTNYYILNNFVR